MNKKGGNQMTELEKAVRAYMDSHPNSRMRYPEWDGTDSFDAFVAGAQWQSEQSPWISVEKEEPPLDKPILVIIDGKPDIVTICDWDYITGYPINITHWMYIPEV